MSKGRDKDSVRDVGMAVLHRRSGLCFDPCAEPILNDESSHLAQYNRMHHVCRRDKEHAGPPNSTVNISVLYRKACGE